MKKILVSFIAMMAVASSAWAAETMVSVQREPSGHNLKHPTKWCPPNK